MAIDCFAACPDTRAILAEVTAWRFAAPSLATGDAPLVQRPGHWAQHAHGHRELMFALSGDVPYGVGGQVYRCRAGTWLVLEPFEEHDDGYGDQPPDLDHLWVSLVDDRVFVRIYQVRARTLIPSPVVSVGADTAGEMRRALDDARSLRETQPALARARVAGACAALAARLLAPVDHAAPQDAQSEAIDAILRHIDHCSGKGVSIKHLARIAGYSPFHFARVFRKRTGRTVHQYVDACRRDAYLDLRSRSIAHHEIADRLGFSCASAFSRWLRGQRQHLPN